MTIKSITISCHYSHHHSTVVLIATIVDSSGPSCFAGLRLKDGRIHRMTSAIRRSFVESHDLLGPSKTCQKKNTKLILVLEK